MNIERLEHLHIMGDASAYAHLMRERERRGERWCGGVNEPPPILALEELREWAEVEFFADGLTAVIEESDNTHKPTVYLRQIDSPFPNPVVGVCHVSADGRPRFRVFHAQEGGRANLESFCSSFHVTRTGSGVLQFIRICCPRDGHVENVDQYPFNLCSLTPPHQDQQPTPAEEP